jgi:hypothetical protein
MHSDSFKQLPNFFDLVAFGFFSWVRPMAAPLLILDCDFDAGAFALMHLPTQCDQQGFNVAEDN